ncbi:hypothetical protein OHS33_39715 (plasmid) [Streptomyces sp. NBC_00536]|uniref:hypothetical protein n=1 Tax=Streptomyces sp. NBC_00536 TaxID=2975769 RepID=UPI002E81FD59|nr:hypothetical protein [Streptomyces sp. NBC_00536]WUC84496.1 hypothetical protein OHS33_39715 [Streptomyces sp. NBC_00536]
MDLATMGSKVVDLFHDGITYTVVTAKLGMASIGMLRLSEAVRGAYNYVEGCAASVDNLADMASTLWVEGAVVNAHRDAAAIMRGVLADAESLANEAAEMASDFTSAKEDHEADYGPIAHELAGKDTDRTYYSNR